MKSGAKLQIKHSTHPQDIPSLDGGQLRERFLVEDMFAPGEVRLTLAHDDRMVIGGAQVGESELELQAPAQLRAEFFCQRRELAVVALDEGGRVSVDGEVFEPGRHDILYVGLGARQIRMYGAGSRFYLVSAPAGAAHPTVLARSAEAETLHLGEASAANVRALRRYIHAGGVASDRLVVGITTLAPGSVWNTMPPHLHDRRTEVYLYTELGADDRVLHLCGQPENLRTLVVADGQAVISPPWSIHSGAGTSAYSFVWAMAGENQAFEDMDGVALQDLQ